jgi:hypothetical protein
MYCILNEQEKVIGEITMNKIQYRFVGLIITIALTFAGCEPATNQPATNTANTNAPVKINSNSAPVSTNATGSAPKTTMFTLPMLKAFLADANFINALKTRLQLTDAQISQLNTVVGDPKKSAPRNASTAGSSSTDARSYADEHVRSVIGEEKTQQLAALVNEYWGSGTTPSTNAATPATSATARNVVPTDTRVVVNAPAYRMDIFENGQLVK